MFLLVSNQKTNTLTVYAEETEEIVEFENDETVISSSLWTALKNFYNNNVEESKRIGSYMTFDLFKDFELSKLDLSGKNIDSIENLKEFDLSAFVEIDLSNNKLTSIGEELTNVKNLQKLNLSKNQLTEFSYTSLSVECYSTNLIELNISQNSIQSCNLKLIASGTIDAKQNSITSTKITYPDNLDVCVELSHNLIESPTISNPNINFGFQGAKNNKKYEIGKTVFFQQFDAEVATVEIYKIESDETQTLADTLNSEKHEHTFELGNYVIKFVGGSSSNLHSDINVSICPKKPTAKVYQNGQEITNITYKISTPTTIKVFGDENATISYSVNGNEKTEGNEIELSKDGTYRIKVYQTIDGFESEPLIINFQYEKSGIASWMIVLAGAVLFAVIFYVLIKNIPKLAKLKIGSNSKKSKEKNLD